MKNTGCLLIHGFTGCRNDLEPLRSCLEQRGYNVAIPVLKGHESTARDLGMASRHDWIDCAQTELVQLQKSCETVVVIGFSMGGLIAANLCQGNSFEGIIFINTPVYYWGLGQIIFNLYSDFKTSLKKYMIPARDTPFHAMLKFQLLLSRTKPMFGKIECKSLVLQSVNDDIVDPKSAEFIFSRLKGHKEIKKVPIGGHVVLLSEGAGQVCSHVQHFLKEL